jgi:hypothetical protein
MVTFLFPDIYTSYAECSFSVMKFESNGLFTSKNKTNKKRPTVPTPPRKEKKKPKKQKKKKEKKKVTVHVMQRTKNDHSTGDSDPTIVKKRPTLDCAVVYSPFIIFIY